MATNFPSGLDSFTNPSATDSMDSVSVPHASQHANLNDAVEALEAKVGVDGSAVTSSLDYKVSALPVGVIEYATNGTNGTMTGSEAATITASSFTPVAGRLYRLTYYEPAAQAPAGAGAYFVLRIRANGTQLTQGQVQESGATQVAQAITVSCVTTLTAGATTITANAQTSGGATNLFRSATLPAYLLVEDIGPS